jgi:class 3 adenylate cyclase
MDFLRDYHAEMGKLIFKFEATLERFMGDGLWSFSTTRSAARIMCKKPSTWRSEMRDRVKELRTAWLKKGFNLDLGVGLAAGYATLGTVGFEGRMDYGTVGNLPNLAARLCAEARGGQILTDQKTMAKIEEQFEAEALPDLQLKGINRAVVAFNIVKPK